MTDTDDRQPWEKPRPYDKYRNVHASCDAHVEYLEAQLAAARTALASIADTRDIEYARQRARLWLAGTTEPADPDVGVLGRP